MDEDLDRFSRKELIFRIRDAGCRKDELQRRYERMQKKLEES